MNPNIPPKNAPVINVNLKCSGTIPNTTKIEINNPIIPKTLETVPLYKINNSEIFFSSPPK